MPVELKAIIQCCNCSKGESVTFNYQSNGGHFIDNMEALAIKIANKNSKDDAEFHRYGWKEIDVLHGKEYIGRCVMCAECAENFDKDLKKIREFFVQVIDPDIRYVSLY